MRLFILLITLAVLSSSSCEDTMQTNTSKEETQEASGTPAIVTTKFADEGCAVLLEMEEEGQKVLLMPIELEEKFKKDGLKVSIEFTFSRIMQSECQKGRPIVIQSIKFVE
ncbi:MAG: hypothetical protein AB8B56_14765 [Crocinitomicaceae bacterium]